MTATISSWGNSQGLRLPKEIINALHLSIGDKVNVLVENQKIVLKPLKHVREKYDIHDLVKQLPADYKAYEEFDTKAGSEAW